MKSPLELWWGNISNCRERLLLSSSGVLVGCSIVVVCWVLSSYGEGLFSCNIFSESSLIAVFRGLLSFLVGGSHLYLLQSDSF